MAINPFPYFTNLFLISFNFAPGYQNSKHPLMIFKSLSNLPKLNLIFLFLTFVACHSNKSNLETTKALLTIDQVGAKILPDTIAEVKAPFPFQNMQKPNFGTDTILISNYLSEGDTMLTPILNQLIDSISTNGGGIIKIPDGNWLSGRIILKSNVEVNLSNKASIYFSGKIEDYQPAVFSRFEGIEVMSPGACVYANNQTNIALTGNGNLIGPAKGPIRDKMLTDQLVDSVIPMDLPVEERIYDGSQTYFLFSPMFISPINCKNVFIEGVSISNTAFWNMVPIYCENVIIRGITVNSVGIPRGDGIDVESSKNVLIEYCTLSCGDDCFTMKAGRGPDGIRVNKPSENIVVRYCLAREGHGGITVGSETAGMIKNLYIHDCVFDNTGVGIRFKTRRPRGGGGENLYYERLVMNLRYTAIKWDMLGSTNSVGKLAERLPEREINELTPHFKNIFISDLKINKCDHFLKIYGIPESPVKNLVIENSEINSNQLIVAHDASQIKISNTSIATPDSLIQLLDCSDVVFNNVNFEINNSKLTLIKEGSKTKDISFNNCSPSEFIEK